MPVSVMPGIPPAGPVGWIGLPSPNGLGLALLSGRVWPFGSLVSGVGPFLQPAAAKIRARPNMVRFENFVSFISFCRLREAVGPNWVVRHFPKLGMHPCIVWLARQAKR